MVNRGVTIFDDPNLEKNSPVMNGCSKCGPAGLLCISPSFRNVILASNPKVKLTETANASFKYFGILLIVN